jgi:hypothetical protein
MSTHISQPNFGFYRGKVARNTTVKKKKVFAKSRTPNLTLSLSVDIRATSTSSSLLFNTFSSLIRPDRSRFQLPITLLNEGNAQLGLMLACFSRQLNSLTVLSLSHLPQTCTLPLPCLTIPYLPILALRCAALHCTFLSHPHTIQSPCADGERVPTYLT